VSSLVLGDKEAEWVEWVSVGVEEPLVSPKKVERGKQEKEADSGETSWEVASDIECCMQQEEEAQLVRQSGPTCACSYVCKSCDM